MKKLYSGACYIGVVGGEHEIGECRDSIEKLQRRPGDSLPRPIRATKGFEARQLHFSSWLNETDLPFLLLLDHDMVFAPDTLERLRTHGRPYVSGFYLRRRYAPLAPVWFEYGARGAWPLTPWLDEPERGKLHKLGASGWGCLLIHREVVEAVGRQLKGESFVQEDDMDVWPYDLPRVMQAIAGLRTLTIENPPRPALLRALSAYTQILVEELRPLRGMKTNVGSDIRFPFFAREAGYVLMGDPDVRPSHMLNYPLAADDYAGVPADACEHYAAETKKEVMKERAIVRQALKRLGT